MELSISTGKRFPPNARAILVTTINATHDGEWLEIPFALRDEKTFTCRIVPEQPGLYSFWALFSLDGGATWQHDPVPDAWVLVDPPQADHLRMYTLIPSVSGTIADWAHELPNIKAMGFNAIHFLPLTTLDTSQSPYSAKDLFGVEPSYLTPGTGHGGLAQLEGLIEVAKALDMRLCFDLVLNHVGVDSQIARRAPEWIMPDSTRPDGLRRARYWSDKGWQPWNDLVLIDYEHPSQTTRADILAYMTEYALFWAKFASDTNGFVRFDNLHSSDKAFVDLVTQALHREYPNVGIVAEYFTDAGTLLNTVPKWGLSLILATPWDHRFVPQLREYLKWIHSLSDHVRFFMPVTSHDSGSPAQEFGSVESTIPRYVAAALLGTGATGITQGVEWGVKERFNFIGKQPKWTPEGAPVFADFLRKVNEILVAEPAFRRGENCQFVDANHHAVIGAFRKDARPGKVGLLVLCNFDVFHQQEFKADLSALLGTKGSIDCVDLMSGLKSTFFAQDVSLVLPACAAQVWRF
ncbi:MAG: alpha-amylase family glycosyl hydrolase [Tepidisphaeraceae bacterium]